MSNTTSINPNLNGSSTQINKNLGQSTSINPNVISRSTSTDMAGVVLAEKFEITGRMNVPSGEADLYVCTYKNEEYVAKVYKREAAIKPEIVDALKKIDSPYIAHSIDIGVYNGFPFEILKYYKNGSLQGRKLSFEELKNNVIPGINEALKALHSNNPKIIHKDLKPSNIMMQDNGKIALIDFGISSVAEGGNTVVNTKTGLTLDYSAPEALRSVFLEESDYYSFGISIYELFTGHTPFAGMNEEQLAQYTVLQQFPYPNDMPEALKDLIKGLTYSDITHRHEENNPNRRWTYKEVVNWCNGKTQPVPGSGASIPTVAPFKFEGQQYTNLHDLAVAFANNWESGKKQLFRNILGRYLSAVDQDLASYCFDAVESKEDNDIVFFKVLYKLDPSLTQLCWKGKVYDNVKAFGESMIEDLRKNNMSHQADWDDILRNKVLSTFISMVYSENAEQKNAISALEAKAVTVKGKDAKAEMLNYYTVAYLLSGDKTYHLNGKTFNTVDDIAEHMKPLLEKSFEAFADFCKKFISEDNKLDPQFEAWLIALGKTKEIEQWRKELTK